MRLFFIFIFLSSFGFGQTSTFGSERYPVFEECEGIAAENQERCFKNTLAFLISKNFEMPPSLRQPGYTGEVVVIFEVNRQGVFEVIYVDAYNAELKEETRRVFLELPRIEPPTYNGNPTNMQFRFPFRVPFHASNVDIQESEEESLQVLKSLESKEYENIQQKEYSSNMFSSQINIPLSHELYSRFDDEINVVGTNSHTASKPLLYDDVENYYSFENEKSAMKKDKTGWWGRKLWNEHLVQLQGEDYWFVADFTVDLQLGKDFESDLNYTYNNTRAAILQGGLGQNFNFYASVFESQGRFADYFNAYAESLRPDGGNPAIIPGRGIAKSFETSGYDYPVAEGYLSYTPSKFFNVQFGHGKNFLGDGYRSLFLSDISSPYPYFKLNTSFWKIKYTNIWMSLRDVRPEVTEDGSFRTKYVATHYLSYNVTKRFNLGLFESVIWQNDNNRGFDLNYLNPVIFYRAIEFSTGSRGGNALLGISGKYKVSNSINLYTQLMIDEFSTADIFGGNGSYKNKIGWQLGAKYFNAFNIENLFLQFEYNQIRPFTYSHNSVVLNYGHNNQSLAHLWGANFREVLGIARYRYNRWYGKGKLVLGERGFNYSDGEINYGGDVFVSEDTRDGDTGHEIGQGNTATSFYGELEAGYIVNPSTNLKLFGTFIYRDISPIVDDLGRFGKTAVWFNLGLRADIFNWYFDY